MEKRHTVEIVSTNKNPVKNTHCNDIPLNEFPAWTHHEAYYFSPQAFSHIRKTNADIIHAMGYNNLVTLAALLAKKRNQKFLLTLQSSGSSSFFRKLLWIPYTFIVNLLSRRIDWIVCISEFEKKRFMKKLWVPKDRFVIIPNGVDVEFIDSISASTQPNQIISIGRLVKNKGFEDLVRAFAIVKKQRPATQLQIIGSGPEEENLKKVISELQLGSSVTFLPFIPLDQRKHLIKLLKSATLFTLLSRYEGQGIVIGEAIIAGRPILLRNNSALSEFIEKGQAAGVEDTDGPETIAKKLIEMLESPARFKPDREGILSWREIAQRTIKLYEKIIQSSK